MNRKRAGLAIACVSLSFLLTGCGAKVQADMKAEAPPPAKVENETDSNLFKVEHATQFPVEHML